MVIGAACLARGASVVLVSRDSARLASTAASLGGGVAISTEVADANDEASVAAVFARLGAVDHVVCTIGPSVSDGLVTELDLAKVSNQLQLKFVSAVSISKHAVPVMRPGGCLVFVSGSLSRRPSPGSSVLAACNAALDAFARSLAVELAPKKLRCSTVSPGLTNTEMWASMPAERREGMLAGYGRGSLCGRAGEVEDVGEAIAYLLTATWVTGIALEVDGGTSVKP